MLTRSTTLVLLLFSALPSVTYAQDDGDDGSNIPEAKALGVGIGIQAPTGSFGPNVASVRFRLKDGFALEPSIGFGLNNSRDVVEVPGNETENAQRATDVRLGTDARIRFAKRDNVELMGMAGANLALLTSTNDPEGSENNQTTSTTSVGLGWGFGVNWWAHRNFCLSADVQNPLLTLSSSKTTQEGFDGTSSTSAVGLGVAISPTARMMGHVTF